MKEIYFITLYCWTVTYIDSQYYWIFTEQRCTNGKVPELKLDRQGNFRFTVAEEELH